MKNKTFNYEVVITFNQTIEAESEKDAREQLKETFKQDYNLDLTNDEITLI